MIRSVVMCILCFAVFPFAHADDTVRPNIFIAISDDQSWPHASAYGSTMVQTPNFDLVAREGLLFTQAFSPSPGCSPSRAAFLTGLQTWQLEHAGTHASYFDPNYVTFPDRLAAEGYWVGYCGKGWGPGDFKKLGRDLNPAGPRFATRKQSGRTLYAEAFREFLKQRPDNQPFCFWFGSSDPHRSYKKGSGIAAGKRLQDAEVPPFLPDNPEIRSDLLDYAVEVERFDSDLGEMLQLLRETGELSNTLVIVTSDNGIPVPRAKANCYEFGIHMPLAVRWGEHTRAGRVIDDLVGFVDLTATIYDLTGVTPPEGIVGKSISNILSSESSGRTDPERTAVYSARERHSSSRFNSLGYPQRCIRTNRFLYIHNFKPERWPAGPARKYSSAVFSANGSLASSQLGPPGGAYHDIDACPTLTWLIQHQGDSQVKHFLDLAVARRPRDELFDIQKDPACLHNLSESKEFQDKKKELSQRLMSYLKRTGDPRVNGSGDVWETYPRVSSLRWFPKPDWAVQDAGSVPEQPWLDARRPKGKSRPKR